GLVPYVEIDVIKAPSLSRSESNMARLMRFASERKQALKTIYQRYPSFRQGDSGANRTDSVSSLMHDMSLGAGGPIGRVDSATGSNDTESSSSGSDKFDYAPSDGVTNDESMDEDGVIPVIPEESSEEEEGLIHSSDSGLGNGRDTVNVNVNVNSKANDAFATGGGLSSSKCDFCALSLGGAEKTIGCGKCHMAYHGNCYDKVVMRSEIDLLQLRDKSGLCAFCAKFGKREVASSVTWRGASRIGLVKFANVDILVKWRGFSYRELSWIPLIWHLKLNRFGSMALRHRVAANLPPPRVEDVVRPAYLEPSMIIDVTRCVSSMRHTRIEALESSGISLDRSKWELYTDYSRLQVAWSELGLDEATWEKPP
ncbi:hypothetical protein LPJ56_006571, partial [Coemansia sp. RSA 2599]